MSIDAWRGWKPATPRPRPPAPEPTTEFGRMLRVLRERRGISQPKLAERAEVDHSYVSRLETGARTPSRAMVARLADALALSDAERDGLLTSAGFLPRDVTSLLTSEPAIGLALDALTDPLLPEARKADLRAGVELLVRMTREG